jgi:hypothetical protein
MELTFGKIVVDGQTCGNDIEIVECKLVSNGWGRRGHSGEIAGNCRGKSL